MTGDGSGLREMFEPGTHLLAVRRDCADGLAQALKQLISSPERRASLGARGRERATEVGSPERIGQELKRVIEGHAETRV